MVQNYKLKGKIEELEKLIDNRKRLNEKLEQVFRRYLYNGKEKYFIKLIEMPYSLL